MSLVFKQLENGEEILRCQFILANRMQCYKGSAYKVTNSETNTVETYCLAHARIVEAGILAENKEQTQPVEVKNNLENKTEKEKQTDKNQLEEKKREQPTSVPVTTTTAKPVDSSPVKPADAAKPAGK